jgi:hypothetical protein
MYGMTIESRPRRNDTLFVMPVQTGIQWKIVLLDSGFHRDDAPE